MILEKGEKYKDVSDIIVIYLTKEDIFKKGSTVYDVDMNIVSDKNEVVEKWEPGLVVKYINTEGLTNKKIKEYLELLKDKTTIHKDYEEISRIKKDVFERGGITMSKWFYDLMEEEKEKGMQQGREEERKSIFDRLVKQGLITEEEAKRQLTMA